MNLSARFQLVWGLHFLLVLSNVEGLEPPYVMRDKDTGKLHGLMIDVLAEAGILLDHINTPVHDTYGWEQDPKLFDAIVGDLVQGKYDLAVAPFSIRSKRAKLVTFTQPVLHAGYMVLYKTPKDKWLPFHTAPMATLLKPFSPDLWCLIILTGVVASIVLYVIRRYSPCEANHRYNDGIATTSVTSSRADNSLATMSWGSGLMYFMGSLTGRNASVTPRSTSGRILTGVWWVFSLMTVTAYVAGLVVVLFKSDPHVEGLPFAGVEEMISQTEVKVLGVKDSATFHYMASHKGFFEKKIYQYWKHNWDKVMVNSFPEALRMVENGNGAYALFMDEALADYLASQEPCDKMVIGEPVGDETIGFACQKGSRVCDDMDHVILGLQEAGKMEKLREKYFWSGCHMSSEIYYSGNSYFDTFGGKEPGILSPNSITIRRFSSAFIILIIGLALALGALAAEVFYYRRMGTTPHHQLKSRGIHDDAQKIHDPAFSLDQDA